MGRLKPLPASLATGPFTVAEALEAGVSPRRLRHPTLTRPTKAVRSIAPPDTLVERAHAVARGLREPWAFSHLTAARLLALPMPTVWSVGEPLHVMCESGQTRIRRPEVVGHRGLESRTVTTLNRLPITATLHTWLDLANAASLDDLVIAGDVVAHRHLEASAELAHLLSTCTGMRGRRKALAALALVRCGSRSPMETRARLAFVRGGLPEPELKGPIVDAAGEWVATADFVWRAERVIVEYEGDQHCTDRRQWQADLARTRLLEALGWKVIRITARDLAPDRVLSTVAFVSAALRR